MKLRCRVFLMDEKTEAYGVSVVVFLEAYGESPEDAERRARAALAHTIAGGSQEDTHSAAEALGAPPVVGFEGTSAVVRVMTSAELAFARGYIGVSTTDRAFAGSILAQEAAAAGTAGEAPESKLGAAPAKKAAASPRKRASAK